MSRRLITALAFAACLAACEHGKGGGVPATDASGSGLQCGGFAGTQCPIDEFCDFRANNCGGTDETGICVTRPTFCDLVLDPECGCDGQQHDNACSAAAAGFDIDASDSCMLKP